MRKTQRCLYFLCYIVILEIKIGTWVELKIHESIIHQCLHHLKKFMKFQGFDCKIV